MEESTVGALALPIICFILVLFLYPAIIYIINKNDLDKLSVILLAAGDIFLSLWLLLRALFNIFKSSTNGSDYCWKIEVISTYFMGIFVWQRVIMVIHMFLKGKSNFKCQKSIWNVLILITAITSSFVMAVLGTVSGIIKESDVYSLSLSNGSEQETFLHNSCDYDLQRETHSLISYGIVNVFIPIVLIYLFYLKQKDSEVVEAIRNQELLYKTLVGISYLTTFLPLFVLILNAITHITKPVRVDLSKWSFVVLPIISPMLLLLTNKLLRTECRQRLGKCSRKIYLSKKKQTERVPSVSSTHREQSTNTENSSKFDFSDPAFLARIANELAYPKTGGVAPKLHISLPNINIISTPEVVLRVDHEGGHISSEQHQTGSDAIQSELSLVEMDEGGRVNRNFLHVEKQQKDEEIYLSHSHPSREFFL